jgi:hypothetical protein
MTQVVVSRAVVPDREAEVLGRLLVATAEIGFRTLLDEPGRWDPDELAAFLAGILVGGFNSREP